MHYTGEHFSNQPVRLDGNQFDGCRFTNVIFEYAGGPIYLCGCRFEGFRWQFEGDLARGLAVLGQLYGDNQAAAITQVARAIFPKTAAPAASEAAPRIHASLAAILDSADEDDAAAGRRRGAIGGFERGNRRLPAVRIRRRAGF